ncbi:MAG TPA: NrfD/PsrC family molybdoenzyme membrane anchor subunit, partial [Myxococcota bacterium]
LHLGRAWFFYWLVPYPARTEVWPQFRSALTWDVGAVGTYTIVSILFWYLGLLPDLAAARDDVTAPLSRRKSFGLFALGWRGTAAQWSAHSRAKLLLAGLATPLVVSVHSVVSFDFSTALVTGWHSTIFPPYFVVGALFSGFAMLLTLVIPLRRVYGIEDLITARHLDVLARIILALGLVMAYSYGVEHYLAATGDDARESTFVLALRPTGPYALLFWLLLSCNVAAPQLLWFRRVRASPLALFIIALVINCGMWLERFVIIAASLSRDFLPSSWAPFRPSWVDLLLFAGSLSFFSFLFFVFLRIVPFLPISELADSEARDE